MRALFVRVERVNTVHRKARFGDGQAGPIKDVRRFDGIPRSPRRHLVQQLKQLVGCELDRLVAPLGSAVMAGNDA